MTDANADISTPRRSWRERLFAGLTKTRQQIGGSVRSLFSRGKVDDELLEELEALLLTSDVGIEATKHLLDELKARAKRDKLDTPEGIQRALAECAGNVSEAARRLGMHRRSLQRKLSKYPPADGQ